jgi:hypothetical protein
MQSKILIVIARSLIIWGDTPQKMTDLPRRFSRRFMNVAKSDQQDPWCIFLD